MRFASQEVRNNLTVLAAGVTALATSVVKAAADLPISPRVHYHSIIGNYTPDLEVLLSSDGVVPYASSHLAGADSELVVPSWHSVQETPQAIIEIRRVLHEHLTGLASPKVATVRAP